MLELSSEISVDSFCNTDPLSSNNYNPSTGNFLPFLTEEMQNMIKTLKMDSLKYKISNDYQDNTLVAVIDCLIYHHYDSIKNRDKQLCKPLRRLFNNTNTQEEIIDSIQIPC